MSLLGADIPIGVIEGFFGPCWTPQQRRDWAPFLKAHDFDFFLYAPKQDQRLRKAWREGWPEDVRNEWRALNAHYKSHGLDFGVGLSPMGLEESDSYQQVLLQKTRILSDLGIRFLAILFDDMTGYDEMLNIQLEAISKVRENFDGRLVFCPSYYSFDPILEKVFGKMPQGYWSGLAEGVPASVDIFWTGPKVISDEITEEHLREVESLFARRPFLFDNVFANDGPKNCRYLKLKTNIQRDAYEHTSGWGFNPMNQSALSMVALKMMALRAQGDGLQRALEGYCHPRVVEQIMDSNEIFLDRGLENLDEGLRNEIRQGLGNDIVSQDIKDWLDEKYIVDSDCLTD